MSSIQRTMTRAMARTGFAKKMIALQKEKQQRQQEKRGRLFVANVDMANLAGNDQGIYVEKRTGGKHGGIFIHN